MDISIFIVFSAGLASFLSPCTLPIIPLYVSYMTGVNISKKSELKKWVSLKHSVAFVLGFSTIFVLIQLIATYFANFFAEYLSSDIFYKIVGSFVIILGLHMSGVFTIKGFLREKRVNFDNQSHSVWISYLLGFFFGFGWSPCIGPILGAVILYSSQSKTLIQGILYLLIYSLGLGLPFIIFSVFLEKLTPVINYLKKKAKIIKFFSGIIIIIMGLLLFFNKLSLLAEF